MPNLASGPQNHPRAKVAVSKFLELFKSIDTISLFIDLSVSIISPAFIIILLFRMTYFTQVKLPKRKKDR
jgi:hypothetical protein